MVVFLLSVLSLGPPCENRIEGPFCKAPGCKCPSEKEIKHVADSIRNMTNFTTINYRGSDDRSALEYASEYGYLEIVKALVECGAKRTSEAIELAKFYNYNEIVDYLES